MTQTKGGANDAELAAEFREFSHIPLSDIVPIPRVEWN